MGLFDGYVSLRQRRRRRRASPSSSFSKFSPISFYLWAEPPERPEPQFRSTFYLSPNVCTFVVQLYFSAAADALPAWPDADKVTQFFPKVGQKLAHLKAIILGNHGSGRLPKKDIKRSPKFRGDPGIHFWAKNPVLIIYMSGQDHT